MMPRENTLSWNSFPIIRIQYQGVLYPVGSDSGHTETFLDDSWASRLSDLRKTQSVVQGVASQTEEAVQLVDRFTFSIGNADFSLRQIKVKQYAVFGAEAAPTTGLLGADIISGASWVLDAAAGCFTLEKTAVQ